MAIGSVFNVDQVGTDYSTSVQSGLVSGKQDFLKLLVTEMTNQDPLSPMSNQDFIAQLAQMQTLEEMIGMGKSNSQMLHQQEIASASSLIGKTVEAQDEFGGKLSGTVERVTITANEVKLIVDGVTVALGSVTEINPGGE